MENKNLETALRHQEQGRSVIPVKPNKKPFIKWEKHQTERAGQELIKEWWQKWPGANIGIVTGAINDLLVIDIDSQKGLEAFEELIPDNLLTPLATTPGGGWHYYFHHKEGITVGTRFIKDCDFRGEGGYIIAPPSQNGKCKYAWLPGLSIDEITPASLPESIAKEIKNGNDRKKIINSNDSSLSFSQGSRDEDLYHTALTLLKGGMPQNEVNNVIFSLAAKCNPPFPQNEALAKVQSAVERIGNKEQNLMQEVKKWVEQATGIFTNKDLMEELNISRDKKGQLSVYLNRLAEKGTVVKTGGKYGQWRRIEEELSRISLRIKNDKIANIKLPFGLNDLVEMRPGNIIVIAGSPNAGKSAFILNCIADNMYTQKCHYFSSEMAEYELPMRLGKFGDVPWDDWDKYLNAYPRSENFADVIQGGEGNINFIDYIELRKDFYEIVGHLKDIHDRLNGAIAIVALQKNPGVEVARGGYGSLEKPRLYLAMDAGKMTIVKAKNWKKGNVNPNGMEMEFKLVNGSKFQVTSSWKRPVK